MKQVYLVLLFLFPFCCNAINIPEDDGWRYLDTDYDTTAPIGSSPELAGKHFKKGISIYIPQDVLDSNKRIFTLFIINNSSREFDLPRVDRLVGGISTEVKINGIWEFLQGFDYSMVTCGNSIFTSNLKPYSYASVTFEKLPDGTFPVSVRIVLEAKHKKYYSKPFTWHIKHSYLSQADVKLRSGWDGIVLNMPTFFRMRICDQPDETHFTKEQLLNCDSLIIGSLSMWDSIGSKFRVTRFTAVYIHSDTSKRSYIEATEGNRLSEEIKKIIKDASDGDIILLCEPYIKYTDLSFSISKGTLYRICD
jgi:hypothetical protein